MTLTRAQQIAATFLEKFFSSKIVYYVLLTVLSRRVACAVVLVASAVCVTSDLGILAFFYPPIAAHKLQIYTVSGVAMVLYAGFVAWLSTDHRIHNVFALSFFSAIIIHWIAS